MIQESNSIKRETTDPLPHRVAPSQLLVQHTRDEFNPVTCPRSGTALPSRVSCTKKQFKGRSTIVCSKMEKLSGQWEKENNIQQNSEKNGVRKDSRQIEMCEEKQ
jgi:hypothetical protein